MTGAAVAARADRVLDELAGRGLDCLLVSNMVNLRWLTGFTGTNGAAIVTPEERLFLTDFRYREQAESQVRGFEHLAAGRDLIGDVAARLHGRAGFDDLHLSVRAHAQLQEKAAAGVELVPAGGLVEALRAVKDEEELAAIGEAARLADEVYGLLLERGVGGQTELEVARWLEAELRERGAEPAFPVIVASGAHGALPHAEPRDAEVERDSLMVLDMGARLDGYCSDCTRTFATGSVDERGLAVYEVVREAQGRALEGALPGAAYRDVDALARELIEAAGYGERFGHGVGHGVGMDVHEAPRLAKTSEGALRQQNVVTVEPGVYLPGELGVRIEDLVVVREPGPDVLTHVPKGLLTLP